MNVLVIVRELGEFKSVNIYDKDSTPEKYIKGNFSNDSISRSFKDLETGEWIHADCYWNKDINALIKKKKQIINKKIKDLTKSIKNLKSFDS